MYQLRKNERFLIVVKVVAENLVHTCTYNVSHPPVEGRRPSEQHGERDADNTTIQGGHPLRTMASGAPVQRAHQSPKDRHEVEG